MIKLKYAIKIAIIYFLCELDFSGLSYEKVNLTIEIVKTN